MLVKKTINGYEFESPSNDGAFIVTLTLLDNKKETLHTIPVGVPVTFTPLELKPGTIKQTIGAQRWKNFLRMKELEISTMFIDRHPKEIGHEVW